MIPLAEVRAIVERHFRVYEAREEKVRGQVAAQLFFVMFPPAEFDARYEAVRAELARRDPEALCFLRREAGEDVLFVAARPPAGPARRGLHVALFLLTVVTLTLAGTYYWVGFQDPRGPEWRDLIDPSGLAGGFVTFALPVLLVLGIHEMGHFIAARRHGLRATLPFFIPFPPLGGLPLGTLGAFISLRDPLPDRKTLFDVGASGPLAGFLVALPLVVAGSWLTHDAGHEVPDLHRPEIDAPDGMVSPDGEGAAVVMFPDGSARHLVEVHGADDYDKRMEHRLKATYMDANGTEHKDAAVFKLAAGANATYLLLAPEGATDVRLRITWDDGLAEFGDPLLVKGLDVFGWETEGLMTHPTFIAGWVGLLVTGINLLPVSQLDGGHVARAVLGDRMRYAAFAAVGLLVGLTLMFGSWGLMALLIVLMGVHHPPPLNDRTPLDGKRMVVAGIVLLVLIVTFVPVPFIL